MFQGFYNLTSGMMVQSQKLDVISNNMANAKTPGYKADTYLGRNFREEMMLRTGNVDKAELRQLGVVSMAKVGDSMNVSFEEGAPEQTDGNLDFAINGKGFFTVRDNEGNLFYTRDGAFKVNRDGYLVTSSGYSVLNSNNQPIYVGNNSVSVDTNNNVVLSSGAVHRFNIVDFQDYNSLNKVGSNLYTGEGATATNNYTVKNMQIEGSNVDIIQSTADLMSNLRAFEANQKVVQIMDSTLSKIANEIGTVR